MLEDALAVSPDNGTNFARPGGGQTDAFELRHELGGVRITVEVQETEAQVAAGAGVHGQIQIIAEFAGIKALVHKGRNQAASCILVRNIPKHH